MFCGGGINLIISNENYTFFIKNCLLKQFFENIDKIPNSKCKLVVFKLFNLIGISGIKVTDNYLPKLFNIPAYKKNWVW